MTREVKANTVFIIALLIIATPGLFIMLRKRMERAEQGPGGDFMRSVVPRSVAFNQPPPYRPDLPKLEPTVARQWIEEQVAQRLATTHPTLPRRTDGLPVMSDGSRLQLLSVHTKTTEVLLWDNPSETPTLTPAPQAMQVTAIPVPKPVRHALQSVGYVNPPEDIRWLTITWPMDLSGVHFKAEYSNLAGTRIVENIEFDPQ